MRRLSYLNALKSEAIHILRDGVAEAKTLDPLFSSGKSSTWEIREVLKFRNHFAAGHGFELVLHHNEAGRAQGALSGELSLEAM